jgi:hypothetical protein
LVSEEVKAAVMTWVPSEVKACEQVAGVRTPPDRVLEQKVPLAAESLNVTVPVCGTVVPG